MNRISTADSYAAVVANIMTAQQRLNSDADQLSSGNVASDLQGYASHAETLTAMQTVQSQVSGYLSNDGILADKLTTQDGALQQIAGSATGASQAIRQALAQGDGSSLMQSLGVQFQSALQGLNTTYNGEYIFAGGQVTTAPVNVNSLTALGAAGSVASVFTNDQQVAQSQISQNTTIQTGFLASSVGSNLFGVLQNIQQYVTANGPFTSQLTTAQITYLQQQMTALDAAAGQLTDTAAQNGGIQSQVANTQNDLTNYQTTLGTMIGNVTSANVAQVSANLQQAQLAIQASAQVFLALQNASLLNVLTASGH